MRQSRKLSVIESAVDTIAGFSFAIVGQVVFLPLLYGIQATPSGTIELTAVFAILSALNRYFFRRIWNRSDQQSRHASILESITVTTVGITLQMLAQVVFLPLIYSVPATVEGTVGLTAAFAILTIIRRFCIRRLFEAIDRRMAQINSAPSNVPDSA